jgi:hypothetical protein
MVTDGMGCEVSILMMMMMATLDIKREGIRSMSVEEKAEREVDVDDNKPGVLQDEDE